MTRLVLTIDASRFHEISAFYDEINRVFMAAEEWRLGDSLDALDDMMRGGYGALKGIESAEIRWAGYAKSRVDLGHDTTRRWLREKLEHPERFNARHIADQLARLERGEGQTYFEIVIAILRSNPRVTLVPA